MTDFVPTPTLPAPDIVRCAYMEIVVTDLARHVGHALDRELLRAHRLSLAADSADLAPPQP